MKYYVLKLIPPRPTFMVDMSAAERALMQSHAEFWRSLMMKGLVIVFGPVADPSGPYGLCVMRLDEKTDPSSVWSEDPVIKAQLGFRAEVAPMPRAVHP